MKKLITNFALYSLIVTAYSGNLVFASDDPIADSLDDDLGIESFLSDLDSFETFDDPADSTDLSDAESQYQASLEEDTDTAQISSNDDESTETESTEAKSQESSNTVTSSTASSPKTNFRFSAPEIPEDASESSKVLYRIPGAVEHKGSTMINFYSNKTKNKYIPCEVGEDQTTSQALYNLKLSQGAPKYCRESIEYNLIPYRTFRRDF